MQGGEHSNFARAPIEQEADLFAAELLIPRKRLRDLFSEAFGEPISGKDGRLELIQMHKPHLSMNRLANQLRLRSLLIAEACSLGPQSFFPLYRYFGVSLTAMAIQLEDLRLVI
jgi:Zn-dependent peptidase ImmA (M78 family)